MFSYSESLRVNIDIMFLGRRETCFRYSEISVGADIFEIKFPKNETFFFKVQL